MHALHGKLDQKIKSNADARDAFIGLENRSEEEISQVRGEEGLPPPGSCVHDLWWELCLIRPLLA